MNDDTEAAFADWKKSYKKLQEARNRRDELASEACRYGDLAQNKLYAFQDAEWNLREEVQQRRKPDNSYVRAKKAWMAYDTLRVQSVAANATLHEYERTRVKPFEEEVERKRLAFQACIKLELLQE